MQKHFTLYINNNDDGNKESLREKWTPEAIGNEFYSFPVNILLFFGHRSTRLDLLFF